MSYRDDLAALDARVDVLRHEAATKIEELERAQRLVTEARQLVRARVLEAEIATPCPASWADMKGDDRVRYCGGCKKHVYNFAELTRDEIDAVITKHEGKPCARLFVRADGMMITKDCVVQLRKPSRLVGAIAVGAVGAAFAVAAIGNVVSAHPPARSSLAAEYDEYAGEISIGAEPAAEEAYVGEHERSSSMRYGSDYAEVSGLFNAAPGQGHQRVK